MAAEFGIPTPNPLGELKYLKYAFYIFVYAFKIIVFMGAYWILIFLLPFLAYDLAQVLFVPYDLIGTCSGVFSLFFSSFPWLAIASSCVGLFLMVMTTTQNVIRVTSKNKNYEVWSKIAKTKNANENGQYSKLLSGNPEGFIFGRLQTNFVRKAVSMDGHILTIGGAGSGKSSCVAIPSLMSWESRVFAVDIKGELYEKTKGHRPNIKVFNPMKSDSDGYNPYYLLAQSRNPVQDAREIALAIIPKPENIKEPFWIESAQNIFTGAILHFFNEGFTFIQTIRAIQSTPIEKLVSILHSSPTEDARYFVNQLVGMDIKTLSGVFSEVSNKIMAFATDPDLKACLSKDHCVTPENIERGYDVYLNIPEHKLEQWKGLLTLIINQFLKHFERRPDTDAAPVLFLLDEFSRLGKIETVIHGLATLRSKKVTICVLTQSLAQLDVIYGKEQRQVIADNCQYKAVLNATDADTQDYFSRLVDTFDKVKYSKSANYEQYSGLGKGTGTSETTEEKRIIKPEEFGTLEDIVLLTPFGFLRIDRAPYYSDKAFS